PLPPPWTTFNSHTGPNVPQRMQSALLSTQPSPTWKKQTHMQQHLEQHHTQHRGPTRLCAQSPALHPADSRLHTNLQHQSHGEVCAETHYRKEVILLLNVS